jgi:hypothetical protein
MHYEPGKMRHITHHTSHITHHTSHITHHTSHITHHTSHITHDTSRTRQAAKRTQKQFSFLPCNPWTKTRFRVSTQRKRSLAIIIIITTSTTIFPSLLLPPTTPKSPQMQLNMLLPLYAPASHLHRLIVTLSPGTFAIISPPDLSKFDDKSLGHLAEALEQMNVLIEELAAKSTETKCRRDEPEIMNFETKTLKQKLKLFQYGNQVIVTSQAKIYFFGAGPKLVLCYSIARYNFSLGV